MTSLATQTGFDTEAYLAWEERQAEKWHCQGAVRYEPRQIHGRGIGARL